jgi:hypothetical protein
MKLTVSRRIRVRSARDAAVRSRPASRTVPDVGASSAPIRFSSVVLPDPDAPSTTTNAVSSTCRFTSSTAFTTVPPTRNQRHTSSRSMRVPADPLLASTTSLVAEPTGSLI